MNTPARPSALLPALLLAAALLTPAVSPAQNPSPGGRGQIYGSQLMTPQERLAHRQQMRTLRTAEERQAFRDAHHAQMQARAKERGMTLPETPPRGGGPGRGQGRGMGASAPAP